jgi:ABC-2 type transport system permease protein
MSDTDRVFASNSSGPPPREPGAVSARRPAPTVPRRAVGPVAPRHFGRVNWIGLWTLYKKEVHRFMKVFTQTVLAPTVTTLLFLAIFSLALGGANRVVGGMPFVEFLAPGLIMMAIVQNAFANTSSSMMIAKIQGSIVDLLMPPLNPGELTLAFVMGGVTRGALVGVAVGLATWIFVPLRVVDVAALVFFALAASVMLSLMGLLAAIWSDKFDHMAAITNFVITPLAFLSGTFYSVERLPEPWHTVSQFNPFFYMIDGFRSAFIGHADGSLAIGVAVLLVCNGALWALCHTLFKVGYKLKE